MGFREFTLVMVAAASLSVGRDSAGATVATILRAGIQRVTAESPRGSANMGGDELALSVALTPWDAVPMSFGMTMASISLAPPADFGHRDLTGAAGAMELHFASPWRVAGVVPMVSYGRLVSGAFSEPRTAWQPAARYAVAGGDRLSVGLAFPAWIATSWVVELTRHRYLLGTQSSATPQPLRLSAMGMALGVAISL